MTTAQAIKILEDFNKWRRGKEAPMLSPEEIGKALDFVINGEHLLGFLIHLNEKGLINNHDFEYEKEVKKYIKKLKKEL